MSEIEFEITRWDALPAADGDALYAAPAEGPALGRARMEKRYRGELEGEAVGDFMACGQEGYLAMERVTGTLAGRRGSFVLQHGGIDHGDGETTSFGHVVRGSGTGELAGLRGDARITHGRLQLDWELPRG